MALKEIMLRKIVPSTWWEGGAMVQHEVMDGLGLDLAVTSGLKARK